MNDATSLVQAGSAPTEPVLPDLTTIQHHPVLETIVDILCMRTENNDRNFFRIVVAYFMGKMAATMRTQIETTDEGRIPVNVYAMALSVSGTGKGYSVDLMENSFLSGFQSRFMEEALPQVAENNLWEMAAKNAAFSGDTEQKEYEQLEKVFKGHGPVPFTFDSGSIPAVKQLRAKLLMAGIGAINLQIDEIGSNLNASDDVLKVFLELFDQGQAKTKLTKQSMDNSRTDDVQGKTPSNMLLFGTPSKLLDGGMTEDEFNSLLETGYARRCLFGYGQRVRASAGMSATEIYRQKRQKITSQDVETIERHFTQLADPTKLNWDITVPDDVGIMLVEYKIQCERKADLLPEVAEVRKTELVNRYSKALKLAGAFAFIDEDLELSMDNLLSAIKLVEECSGEAFDRVLTRDKNYVRLAKYLADVGIEQTHADLTEALGFYKQGPTLRREMMDLAIAWGYKNNHLITKTFLEGIEFFTGERLKETNLDEITVSYSNQFAAGYIGEQINFLTDMPMLVQQPGYSWCNHHFKNEHRNSENLIPGFNMIVLDVDEGTPIFLAQKLFEDYTYLMYTTKRHDEENGHRYRILLPINYNLKLDRSDYIKMMENIIQWMPFVVVDGSSTQPEKKWLSHDGGSIYTNEKNLFDVLPFIPKTQRNEEFHKNFAQIANLGNLERWFAGKMVSGQRNMHMIRYALALYSQALTYPEIEARVLHFNNQLADRLGEDELRSTVLTTIAKKFSGA